MRARSPAHRPTGLVTHSREARATFLVSHAHYGNRTMYNSPCQSGFRIAELPFDWTAIERFALRLVSDGFVRVFTSGGTFDLYDVVQDRTISTGYTTFAVFIGSGGLREFAASEMCRSNRSHRCVAAREVGV